MPAGGPGFQHEAAGADLAEVLALEELRGRCLREEDGGDGAVDLGPEVRGAEVGEAGGELAAELEAGGAFGEESVVGEGGLLADLAGAVEFIHGGAAEGAEGCGGEREAVRQGADEAEAWAGEELAEGGQRCGGCRVGESLLRVEGAEESTRREPESDQCFGCQMASR